MRIRLRHVLIGGGLLAIAACLAVVIVLSRLPDHSRDIPAEARGRFAGRWVLESAPSAKLAVGRQALVIESHPPHVGSGRSYLVTWDGASIPARSQLRPPTPEMRRVGVFLAYEELAPQADGASPEGFYVNLFTDRSPNEVDDFLYVDLRPEEQVAPGGGTYHDVCLLYVRAE